MLLSLVIALAALLSFLLSSLLGEFELRFLKNPSLFLEILFAEELLSERSLSGLLLGLLLIVGLLTFLVTEPKFEFEIVDFVPKLFATTFTCFLSG